jgi:hypothetical protein
VFERTQPSVQRSSSEWFGVWQPIEPLATGGSVELWRATRESGGSALLRLYPRFQRQDTWRQFKTVATRRAQIPGHSQLVAVDRVGSYGRPHLLLDDPVGEPLATRVEREPLSPAVALQVFEDVATALDALARAGVPPLELSPADVFVAGDRGLLLADVGTLGEVLRGRCLNVDHAAPERVAMAERVHDGAVVRLLARLSPWHAPRPTTATMGYSFASVLRAALVGPAETSAGVNALPARAQRVLDRTLAPRYRRRHSSPARIVKALQKALATPKPTTPKPITPEPERVPTETVTRRRSRKIGGRVVALVAGCVLAAAAAGGVTGVATTTPDPPGTAAISRDGVSVRVPAGWRAVGPANAPFNAGASALVVQSAANPDVGLTVTRSGQALLASVRGDEPGGVELRDGDAWRYQEARVGGQRMDAYVLATGTGPIVAACHGPAIAVAALATCDGIVSTLRVRNVQAVPLGGAADARAKLADTLAGLNRRRARGRERLATATTRPAQAAAAIGLARAYADSGDAATGAGVGAPGAQARLTTELAATSRAYSALAAAARGGNAAGYRTARARIAEREQALAGAIAALAPVME